MGTGWRQAVSQNLVANLLWSAPSWIWNGGLAVWIGYMSGVQTAWLLLIGISTLFVTVLVVALRHVHGRRTASYKDAFGPLLEESNRWEPALRNRNEPQDHAAVDAWRDAVADMIEATPEIRIKAKLIRQPSPATMDAGTRLREYRAILDRHVMS